MIGHSFTDLVDESLLDQSVTGMRFKLVGGYGWWPVRHEAYATPDAPPLNPTLVETFFDAEFYGRATPTEQTSIYRGAVSGALTADLRQFIRQHDVDTVVVLPLGKHPATVISVLATAFGPPTRSGGVDVWPHLQQHLVAQIPG
jgi:hypothetical protein